MYLPTMISMLLTKRIYFINEIWILLLLTTNTANCFQIRHGVSSSNFVKFISIAGIPLRQCIDECSARPRCTSGLYHVATHVCLLGSNHVAGDDIVRKPGQVLVYGFDKTFPVLCDGTECGQTETCQVLGTSSLCQVTECGPPIGFDIMHGAILGNMYSIGSKLVYDSCIFPSTLVCGQNGQWSRDLPTSEFATCPGCVGCSTANTGVSFTIHENLIGGQNDKRAFCDVKTDGGNWLVFQRRQDGSEDFYRGWDDYVTGFGDPCGEFWLGLKALHLLLSSTDDTFELRIDLEDFEGDTRYAHYSSVYISGPIDNYRLNLGTYSGTAGGDGLTVKANGSMFSTYDSDNDVRGNNCAQLYKGAWWYGGCHDANLNGLYLRGEYEPYAIGVTWKPFRGQHYSLKHTEMKIRKLNY